MPRCEGRPDGPCPNKVVNSTVTHSQGDLMLCPDCDEYRFPSASAQPIDQPTTVNVSDRVEVNELLCFLQQKSAIMTFDHIVDICASFYTSDEVKKAHSMMQKHYKQRLSMYKGADKDKKTLSDLLKICLDPAVNLPQFTAARLDRLPPVDINHVDLAAILQELSALRSEVRAVGQLRAEISDLRESIRSIRGRPSPALRVTEQDRVGNQLKAADTPPSTAEIVQSAVNSGALKNIPRPVSRAKVLIGTKPNSKIKTVTTRKSVNVFLSRLSPDTAEPDVITATSEILQQSSVDASLFKVECKQLTSKHSSYASYHVAVTVNCDVFDKSIDLLMSTESWPKGVLVRRYYIKKNGEPNRS